MDASAMRRLLLNLLTNDMKHFTLLLFSVLLSFGMNGQQLGFSTYSPLVVQSEESDHTLFVNVGEMLNTTNQFDNFSINDGLFQGRALGENLESYLQVRFFYDEDDDGVKDVNEKFIALGSATVDGNLFINSSKSGILILTPATNFDVSYDPAGLPDWTLTSPAQVSGSLDAESNYAEVQYGVKPNNIYSDIRVVLSSDRLRCFAPVDYVLSVCNFGTQNEQGIVWLSLNELMGDVTFDQEPDFIISDNLVGWSFDLGVSEKLDITFTVIAPEVNEEQPPGTIIKSVAWLELVSGDREQEFCYDQELRCSWDPNDKLVVPNRPDSLGLIDQPLTYTLRFQNTGNDYAEDVVVTDTLSDFLDMSTFQLISTSHPDKLQVEYTRTQLDILNFRFDNIYLPDSIADEEGSNGFITYMISVKPGVPLETEINNTGHIYFDFNPAVVTNTTSTTMVDEYPPVLSVKDEDLTTTIDVYPNPSTGIVFFEREVQEVKVFDLSARLLGTYKDVRKLNLTGMESGSYYLDIIVDDKRAIEKIVLTK